MVEGVDVDHELAHAECEVMALFFNVCEECIAPPTPDEHDSIGWDAL